MVDKVQKSDKEWQGILDPEQYRVLRTKGTERPFSGKYWATTEDGVYRCVGCATPLFTSETKFDAGCGWPSFSEAAASDAVDMEGDTSLGMSRVEVLCAGCGGHLGHLFDDGPEPTGKRFCINSVCLDLDKVETATPKK
jgi:peptide-methionine (R)-S-oxide reductase